MPLFLFFNTQTVHIKSVLHNSSAMFSLKTIYSGGIRTRVFCSISDAMSTVDWLLFFACQSIILIFDSYFELNGVSSVATKTTFVFHFKIAEGQLLINC
jgi:hypothetical protein